MHLDQYLRAGGAPNGAGAFMALLLVLVAGLAGCSADAVSTPTMPQGITLSGAVTGMITSVGSCPAMSQAFSSTWTATLGGAQYTLTVAVDDGHPDSTYYAGVANGYGTRVTLARAGANTVYDSTMLSYEEAGRISITAHAGGADLRHPRPSLRPPCHRCLVLRPGPSALGVRLPAQVRRLPQSDRTVVEDLALLGPQRAAF
jgi:hypothetical protein